MYSAKGVEQQTISQGWHFMSPLKHVSEFPITQQRVVFSNAASDYGAKEHADWHIDAPANGGTIAINLTVNYNFLPEHVVQNDIIAYVKEVTPQFSVMQIYSDDRAGVNTAITNYLNEKLTAEYGINVSSALIVDAQPDDTLMQKIRAKEQAKQDAEIAELNKQTALAQAETDKVKAQTEADVKMIEAQAEADANKVLSESITPELIQMKEAEARLKHGWVTVQGADTVVTKGE